MMMTMNETQFKEKIQKYLNKIGAYHVKQHGSVFTRAGIPDILVCYHGKFIGLELKVGSNKTSVLQDYEIEQIIKSGGIAWVLYPKDFEDFKKRMEALS